MMKKSLFLTVALTFCASLLHAAEWKWQEPQDIPDTLRQFPTEKSPWVKGKDDALRAEAPKLIKAMFGKTIKAVPAAKDFPGVPEDGIKIIDKTITIQPAVGGWLSTGYYALPGEKITVKFPQSVQLMSGDKARFRIRTGCHRDVLNDGNSKWHRMPDMCSSWPIKAHTITITSPFGGLVYIDVATPDVSHRDPGYAFWGLTYIPEDPDFKKIPAFDIQLSGGVAAPYFVLGKTTPAEWQAMLKTPCAPWGEIAGKRAVITLSREQLRQIKDPTETLETMDRGMKELSNLIAWDITNPERIEIPMRIAVDRQLTHGWGHAGYPTMGHMPWGTPFAKGTFKDDGDWGFWHEMGHNHQTRMLQLPGMTEVTVNLFSLAAKINVHKVPFEKSWGGFNGYHKKLVNYFSGTKGFRETNDAALQLMFFVEIIKVYNVKPFRELAIRFAKNPLPPKTGEKEQWGWWAVNLSEVLKRDMVPYFKAWRIPLPEGIEAKTDHFPGWLPTLDFPKQYIQ